MVHKLSKKVTKLSTSTQSFQYPCHEEILFFARYSQKRQPTTRKYYSPPRITSIFIYKISSKVQKEFCRSPSRPKQFTISVTIEAPTIEELLVPSSQQDQIFIRIGMIHLNAFTMRDKEWRRCVKRQWPTRLDLAGIKPTIVRHANGGAGRADGRKRRNVSR